MSLFSLKNILNNFFNLFRGSSHISTKTRKRIIVFIEQLLNHKIRNENIYIEAFTHKSYADLRKNVNSNQRLEFLGDAVLDLVIADALFKSTLIFTKAYLLNIEPEL